MPYGDIISRWTLDPVMTCCLTSPSHHLNQCWLEWFSLVRIIMSSVLTFYGHVPVCNELFTLCWRTKYQPKNITKIKIKWTWWCLCWIKKYCNVIILMFSGTFTDSIWEPWGLFMELFPICAQHHTCFQLVPLGEPFGWGVWYLAWGSCQPVMST